MPKKGKSAQLPSARDLAALQACGSPGLGAQVLVLRSPRESYRLQLVNKMTEKSFSSGRDSSWST